VLFRAIIAAGSDILFEGFRLSEDSTLDGDFTIGSTDLDFPM